jgi:PAS domain S-box-containing protein
VLIAGIWTIVHERLQYEREAFLEDTRTENDAVVLRLEEYVQSVLRNVDHALVFVRYAYLRDGRRLNLEAFLREQKVKVGNVVSMSIFDERGAPLQATGRFVPGNRADDEYFATLQGARDDPIFVGKPHRHEVYGPWTINIARRISRPDGSFAGVVEAELQPADLNNFSAAMRLDPAHAMMLIGIDGIVRVRRTGNDLTFGERLGDSGLSGALASKPHGRYTSASRIGGSPRLMSYRTMSSYGLVVAAGTTEDSALLAYGQHRRDYYALAGLATLTVLAIGIVLLHARARQRRVMESLARNEARFRATFDQAFVGMSQLSPEGLSLQVNHTLCETLGYTEAELLGRPLADHVYPGDARVSGEFAGPVPRQQRLVRKDGGTVWTNAASTLVRDLEGRPDCLVSVVQDISEFKRVDRMKNEFVSMVSHELRTPLTSIRGSLGLIAGGVAGVLPDAAKALVEIANNNCERLIRLINDILDTEKIESGKMRFDVAEVALTGLVERSIAENTEFARQHHVTLALHAPGEPLTVNVDADRLNQVLTNLVSNAVKFSPSGATVDVVLSRAGARARVEVRDRGPGIPEEFRARIFQKFSQADSSDTRQKGGTGLGLNISKSIVEGLGGAIGFTTQSGEGTCFFFEVPLMDAPSLLPADAGREGPFILVCEDDHDIAKLVGMMLERAGYAVDIAYSAEQARALLAQRGYSAMTIDLTLPGEDGISLLRSLRQDPRTHDLPVVVLSARADEGRIQVNDQDLSVSDWLGKPIDELRLVRAIEHAAHGAGGTHPRILHVEDDPDIQRVAAAIVQDFASFEFASNLREARERLSRLKFDIVLLDLQLPDGQGQTLLADIEALNPPPAVVVFSVDELSPADEARVDAVLTKGNTTNAELLETLHRVLQQRAAHRPGAT